jgi:Holliday junction resolvase RusA-like endonuclease
MELSASEYRNLCKRKNGILTIKIKSKKEIQQPQTLNIAASNSSNRQQQPAVQTEIPLENRELRTFFIEITPNTKPRMTRSDKWKNNPNHTDPRKRQRKPVTQYFRFKDELRKKCKEIGLERIPASIYTLKFYIKMPDSWSKKKRELLNGKFHQQTPDIDNLTKALFDSLEVQDNYIAEISNGYGKYWAEKAGILLIF